MRQLIFLIVLAAAAYYGWNYYQEHRDTLTLPWQKTADETPEPGTPAVETPARTTPAAPPEPQFVSKIRMPAAAEGQKPMAPPGKVYVLTRVTAEISSGIVALVPGDLATLLQRRPNGTVRVTNGQADFELKEDQVTLDPEIAQAAEKRDFEMRMPRR